MDRYSWTLLVLLPLAGCRSRLGETWELPDGATALVDQGAADRAAPADLVASVDLPIVPSLPGWPMPGHGPQHTSRSGALGPQHGVVKWTSANSYAGPPVVGPGGTIYMGSGFQAGISALSPVDGHLLWSAPIGCQNLALGPDGTIYADPCTNVPRLCAIDPALMKTKWCAITPEDPILPLVIGDDGTVYASFVSALVALAPSDGKFLWTAKLAKRGLGSALAQGGTVIAVDEGGVTALDQKTGQVKWSASPGPGSPEYYPGIGLDGSIYLMSVSHGPGVTVALDPANGKVRWSGYFGSEGDNSAPAVAADGSLRIAFENGLFAVAANGKELWGLYYNGVLGQPAIGADGVTYIGTRGGVVAAVGPEGKERWTLNLAVASAPVIGTSGLLYATGKDGKLRAIGP
ncbi:MAG: hypothetical protein EXR72_10275 [Myxococcales bacterium]|nr:hypothetical protein [Myxococcales bacterium]